MVAVDGARSAIGGCGYRHLTWLGALWSLPNTLIGLLFCLASVAVPRPRDGLLLAESSRGLAKLFLSRRGFAAITFGRVVISTIPWTPQLLMHESHHSRQYEVLGPFFLPVYLCLHVLSGYRGNALEQEAEACATSARL
jgi:hypothetical protein